MDVYICYDEEVVVTVLVCYVRSEGKARLPLGSLYFVTFIFVEH